MSSPQGFPDFRLCSHYGLGATGYGTVLAEFNELVAQGELSSCGSFLRISLTPHPRAGKVRPVVDSVYPFGDVIEAYARLMTGHTTGKVVVKAPVTTPSS